MGNHIKEHIEGDQCKFAITLTSNLSDNKIILKVICPRATLLLIEID